MPASQYVAYPLPTPYQFKCGNYTNNGKKETITVVIVPVSFIKKDVFTWQIGWSCNFGRTCQCRSCVYSYNLKRES